MGPLPLLLLASLLIVSASGSDVIRMVPEDPSAAGLSGGGRHLAKYYCNSWHLSVEANNAGAWLSPPSACTDYVRKYVKNIQYKFDCTVVSTESFSYAKTLDISGNGKDAWVFDIDETLISNAAIFTKGGPMNITEYYEWMESAKAPAIPASLYFYRNLRRLGFQIILLTGRNEQVRKATERNLLRAGYAGWKKLILKEDSDSAKPAVVFKSEKRAELVAQGYRLHGSSGDQWSDLLGSPAAGRSFKLPNPMYYVP